SEVLEHVPNPAQILAWAWQLLEPGGVLCLSVPNDYNPMQKCLVDGAGHNPWWVVPDHHLNYFNFASLEKLLVRQGYEALQQTTNFPMELFLLMGQNYTQDETLGRKLHGWRKNFDVAIQGQDPQLLEDIYSGLAKAGVGRLVIQFARKPLT
ncbi:MAG: class I SAM-dependent methyltransferase, partial [Kordiimonadaceae bacterium]|nr:class I SAM-dependent methyltransferase [Kordiimonadaceae bacterium]